MNKADVLRRIEEKMKEYISHANEEALSAIDAEPEDADKKQSALRWKAKAEAMRTAYEIVAANLWGHNAALISDRRESELNDLLYPRFGETYRHKKTKRLARVTVEPSGKSGCARLKYDGGRSMWLYIDELHKKFERI